MTVAELIESAARRLRSAGVVKPRREAHRLWAWLNRAAPGAAYLAREESTDAERGRAFESAVERRIAGEPLAYVLGHTGFRNLEIRCDRRALIPRPESEGIVEHALRRVSRGRALDLGTGTGCLALALADEGDFERVVAVDSATAALALAAENAAATGLRIELRHGDFSAALPLEAAPFELIVSNPPYLTAAEYAALDPSVRAWEPAQALVSGTDGLDASRQVLREAIRLLQRGGWLVMELDSTRSAVTAELAERGGWREVGVWNDLFGRPRYLTARTPLTPDH